MRRCKVYCKFEVIGGVRLRPLNLFKELTRNIWSVRILRVGSSRNDRASLNPKGQVSGLAQERTYGLRRGLLGGSSLPGQPLRDSCDSSPPFFGL